jgi:hypothetical protein
MYELLDHHNGRAAIGGPNHKGHPICCDGTESQCESELVGHERGFSSTWRKSWALSSITSA